jgi:hypothetical protein
MVRAAGWTDFLQLAIASVGASKRNNGLVPLVVYRIIQGPLGLLAILERALAASPSTRGCLPPTEAESPGFPEFSFVVCCEGGESGARDMHKRFLMAAALVVAPPAVLAQVSPQAVRTVALSGAAAPGTSGVFGQFTLNDAPVITAGGRIAATGVVPALQRNGLWYYDMAGAQTLSLFSLSGVPIQGGLPGDTWGPGIRPRFLPDGSVVTYTTVAANNVDAIVAGIPGQFQNYARADVQAPGTSQSFRRGGIGRPAVTHSGDVVFRAETIGHDGVWHRPQGGPTSLMVYTGQQAPGFAAGTLYSATTTRPVMTPSGVVAFGAQLDPFSPGVTPDTADLVYQGAAGELVPILRAGDMIGAHRFSRAIRLTQNSQGTVATWANIGFGTSADAIITGSAGNWSVLAARGGQAPGMNPGEFFTHSSVATFEVPVINAQGDVAFSGRFFRPGESSGSGAWHKPAGESLQLVARSGTAAAGLPVGFSIGQVWSELLINSSSDLILTTSLLGPGVTPANERAVYAWHADTGLQLLLRAGDPFPVGMGFRTVSTFDYVRGSGDDGLVTSLNDRREFALRIGFTDGTSGLFVITIPSPGAGALLVALGLCARRRRRPVGGVGEPMELSRR